MALNSIGLIEVSSIAAGLLAEDAMLKAANVDLLVARTICSGKYLVAIGGDVASVQAAVEAGAKRAAGSLIEKRTIVHVHEAVFPAISMAIDLVPENIKSLGFIETFSASSIIDVADAADLRLQPGGYRWGDLTILRRDAADREQQHLLQ
jgi:microcompartment protein CcmL/EutN